MGLLDRLKSNKNNKDFFEWLDLLLKNELSSEIKAIIFNLYEDTDNKWSIELREKCTKVFGCGSMMIKTNRYFPMIKK